MEHKNKAETILKTCNIHHNNTSQCEDIKSVQSNWEALFTILGIYTYDKTKGIIELEKILNNKSVNKTDGLICPPMLPTILWLMIVLGLRDKTILNKCFDNIFQYHKWFVENRDPYKKGIISIFHPWETCREYSPDWNDALDNINLEKTDIIRKTPFQNNNTQIENVRYLMIIEKMHELDWDNKKIYDEGLFNVCDPGVQFIFLRSCKDLYKQAIFLNRVETYKTIEKWIDLYSFGSNYLWNTTKDAYSTLNIKTNTLFRGISCGSMLYAYADTGNKEQRDFMYSHSKRIIYYSNDGFPHCYSKSCDFKIAKYWNGPIWCIMNFMLILGFKQNGQTYLSDKIRINIKKLIENIDFFEFINPHTGLINGSRINPGTAAMYSLFTNKLLN